MCRIYGYLGEAAESEIAVSLEKASRLQYAGGPDEQGYVANRHWGIGANRLAIQGLDGGSQPYGGDDQNIHVVFNGEIYNHKELRRDLEKRGHAFADNCDGSIIPALYHEFGADFVKHLDGMFAIAILDDRDKPRLTLAVDSAGIKPLFYNWNPKTKSLAFSSEIAGLTAFPNVSMRIRPAAVDEFLTTRVVFGADTMYESIQSLEPGQVLSVQLDDDPKIKNYHSLAAKHEYPHNMPPDVAASVLRDMLMREVKKTLESDVPISVIASGGVDSSLIVAMAAAQQKDLHTFHVCSKGAWPMDERWYARDISRFCKTTYHEVEVDLHDFPELIIQFAHCLGQPDTAPQSLGAFAMTKAIRDAGFKVTIGGEGSDELFAGYDRIRNAAFGPATTWLGEYISGLAPFDQGLKRALYSKDYAATVGDQAQSEKKARQLFGVTPAGQAPEERLRQILAFEQQYRLPAHLLRRADHITMANSVELRVPFCQPAIVKLANRLPLRTKLDGSKQTKRVVYDVGQGLLPHSILHRPKQHFILPIAAMYRANDNIRSLMREMILSTASEGCSYFDRQAIAGLLDKKPVHITDEQVLGLWSVLMFNCTTQHITGLDATLRNEKPLIPVNKNGNHRVMRRRSVALHA